MYLTDVLLQINRLLDRENLYEVPISKAVQMTSGESVKTALLLELDISVSWTIPSVTPQPLARMNRHIHFFPFFQAHPTMTYQPGDSFNMFRPNRAVEVEDMLHRLKLYDQRNYAVNICLSKDTKKKGKISSVTLCTFFPSAHHTLVINLAL